MENEGNYIYSIQKMKILIVSGNIPEGLIRYLKRAPENVYNTVIGWVNENIRPELERNIGRFENPTEIKSNAEMNEVISEYSTENDNKEISSEANVEGGPQLVEEVDAIDDNPYKDLIFGNRLDISRLILHSYEGSTCPVHGYDLNRNQVVIHYGNRKKYGMVVRTCTSCKKIYMSKKEWNEVADIVKKKHIPYQINEVSANE